MYLYSDCKARTQENATPQRILIFKVFYWLVECAAFLLLVCTITVVHELGFQSPMT